MWVTQKEIFSNQSKYEAILSIVFNLFYPPPPDKCFFGKFVAATTTTSREKCVWRCFHLVANKGLIWIITTVSKIKPFAGDIFLHGKLVKCTGFIVWNKFWTNRKWIWKSQLFDRLLEHNKFFYNRLWIIRCFKTHCQLSKFTIQVMPFKTKLTSLVNTRRLIDSASLKYHQNNGRSAGGHNWPKTFLGRCT